MTLVDFDSLPQALDRARPTALLDYDSITLPPTASVSVVEVAPVVEESVVVRVDPHRDRSFSTRPDAEWDWRDLRDYVAGEILRVHGPFPRHHDKETGIFKGFMTRWGPKAVAIARVAFSPAYDGMWRGSPINVQRFCAGSDPYFASVIAQHL